MGYKNFGICIGLWARGPQPNSDSARVEQGPVSMWASGRSMSDAGYRDRCNGGGARCPSDGGHRDSGRRAVAAGRGVPAAAWCPSGGPGSTGDKWI
jgi:hypothetical protein